MATVNQVMPLIHVKDGPGLSTVRTELNGHLACQNSHSGTFGVYWCEHIQRVVEHRLDAEVLWRVAETLPNLNVAVPLVPNLDVWVQVRLQGATRGAAYLAYLQVPDLRHSSLPDDEYSIGILAEGEFRWDLRSIVFDWLKSNMPPTPEECKSSTHGFADQIQWEKDLMAKIRWEKERLDDLKPTDPIEWFVQRWSTWYTGFCRTCLAGLSDSDFSGDVPQAESNGQPVW